MDEEQLKKMADVLADLHYQHKLIRSQFDEYIGNHQTDALVRHKALQDKLDMILRYIRTFDDRCQEHTELLALTKVHMDNETKTDQVWNTAGGKLLIIGSTAFVSVIGTLFAKAFVHVFRG